MMTSTEAESMTELECQAMKRKERLMKMKRKLDDEGDEGESTEDASSSSVEESNKLKRPAFRSYNPSDEALGSEKKDSAKPAYVEMEIEEHVAATKEITVVDDIDLTTLAPRKIDWDLKRGVSKKLEKLERRTQKAIAELIRERLVSGKEELLLSAVNSSTQAAQLSDDDDYD